MGSVPDIDEAIARALLFDGRASFSDLSRQLNISRSTVAARVAALVGSGQLRVVAVVHPQLLGLNATAHLSIALTGSATEAIAKLVTRESCVFVSSTAGEFGVMVELRLPTMRELEREIEDIRGLEGVGAVEVLVYQEISRSFFLAEAPDLKRLELDEVDLLVMSELQGNGRMGFGELGERVGLSASAARARLMRLLEANAMQIGAIRRRDARSPNFALGLGIRTHGRAKSVVDELGQFAGIEFVARCFGRFDIVATVAIDSAAAASGVLDRLRSLDHVVSVESWAHLQILKEDYQKPLQSLVKSARKKS